MISSEMLRRRGKYWSKCGLSKCLDDLRSIIIGLIISLFSPKQLINSLSQDQDYVYCWGVLILLFDIAGIGRESVMVPLMWLNHICTQLVLSLNLRRILCSFRWLKSSFNLQRRFAPCTLCTVIFCLFG